MLNCHLLTAFILYIYENKPSMHGKAKEVLKLTNWASAVCAVVWKSSLPSIPFVVPKLTFGPSSLLKSIEQTQFLASIESDIVQLALMTSASWMLQMEHDYFRFIDLTSMSHQYKKMICNQIYNKWNIWQLHHTKLPNKYFMLFTNLEHHSW